MIKGLIFDVNGTVSDILTNENYDDMYRVAANFLMYQGVSISADEIRKTFHEINKRQRKESGEEFPEFDVIALFHEIIERYGSSYTHSLPKAKRTLLPEMAAEVFRAASLFKLQRYYGVKKVLSNLREQYHLSILSDGQSVWAIPELNAVGLLDLFNPIIISSDLGYRKPDHRLFKLILKKMGLKKNEVLYIGNDMFRDIYGAGKAGIKTIFFKSNQGDHKSYGVEPDYIIYNFQQLPEAIRFLSN